MESFSTSIGESELDLIEMMDEVIVESSSLSSFLQMALDLICFGLKKTSGGLVILPNLRQETLLTVWHNPQPGWITQNGDPSTELDALILAVRQDTAEHSEDRMHTYPVLNRRKLIGILILKEAAVSTGENETLRILSRMIGQRVRYFQANTATIGRDQLNTLLRTFNVSAGSADEMKMAAEKILANAIKVYGASAIILLTVGEGPGSSARRQVFLASKFATESQKVSFTDGLLRSCMDSGEIMQWGNLTTNSKANTLIDRVDGVPCATMVGVPMILNGQKKGVIGILDSHVFPLDPVDQSLAMSISVWMARVLHGEEITQKIKEMDDELALKKLEAANSRNALKVLFESSPFLFYIINQDYKIVIVNSNRAKLAGASPADLVGKVCYEALFHNSEVCKGCLVSTTLRTGKSTNRSKRTWSNDTPSDWEVSCYAITNSQGSAVQAVISEQDVTEKRRLEAELLQNEKLVATGQLAASVAHEINNPLAAVIANAQLLLKDIPPQNQDMIESVKLIELAGLRASHVVKNLLGMARKEEYIFTPIDINESIQDALSLLSHEFVARPIAIRFERGQNLPAIMASRENLESIWINLLMNSMEALDDEPGAIEINTFYDEGNFYVLFKDNGVGIPEEQLGRIFEPFFTTKSHGRGTGLGLSVVKRIVQAHSGSIQVDSEIGKGTTFTVILPEIQADSGNRFPDKL
ncbi:MAG: ATP-binding protein [Anaerolineaceae bacterium]